MEAKLSEIKPEMVTKLHVLSMFKLDVLALLKVIMTNMQERVNYTGYRGANS